MSTIGPQHRTQPIRPRGAGWGAPSSSFGWASLLNLDFRASKYFGVGQTWMTAPVGASKTWRWKMQETSGNITDDLSGDAVVLTGTNSPNYATWTPIHSSAGFTRRGMYFSGAASPAQFVGPNNTIGNFGTGDFSFSFWANVSPPTVNKTIAAKAGSKGWDIYVNSANALRFFMSDGVAGPDVALGITMAARTWYFITINVDRDGNASAFVNGVSAGAGSAVSTAFRTIDDTVPMRIGAYGASSEPWIGGIAEFMMSDGLTTLLEHQAMFKAFSDPNALLTYSRVGTVWYDGEENATSGRMVASISPNMFPFAYNPDHGLMFPLHGVTTNICLQSCNLATSPWAGIGAATITEKVSEAPHGQYTSSRILANSAHDGAKQAFGTIAAVPHTFSVMAKKSGGTTGIFHLRLVKNSNNQEIVATGDLTATTKWQRFSLTGTAILNDTRLEIMVDQNEQIDICMCQLTASAEFAGVTILTTTAAAATSAPSCVVAAPTGKCKGARGEIDATVQATFAAQVATGYIVDAVKSSANILLTRTTAEAANLTVIDAAGATQIDVTSDATEFTTATSRIVGSWNATSAEFEGKHAKVGVDGDHVHSGDANWTGADADATIAIGCKADASTHFAGGIITLTVKQ